MKTPNQIHWLNQTLDWRIECRETATGTVCKLYNAFGYAGDFKSVAEALRADAAMSVEPSR